MPLERWLELFMAPECVEAEAHTSVGFGDRTEEDLQSRKRTVSGRDKVGGEGAKDC